MRPAYLSAALPLRSVRRPLFRRGGFRRRKRLFVRPFGAALSLRSVRRFGAALPLRPARRFGGAPAPPGSPLRCGALAHARLAASVRRFVAALSLTLGSPLRRCSRSRPARRFGAALPLALGSPPSVSARRFQAAEKALCATFRCGALAPLGSPLRCSFAPPSSQSC